MGHTPSYSWRAKLFYWWTVSLCHIEANHVTTSGACALAYLATRGKRFLVLFRLLYVGWFVLPTIYEEMWTEILTEIKKNIMKSDFQTGTLIIITYIYIYIYIFFCCCCPCSPPASLTHIADTVLPCCLYQTSRSHLNLTLIKAPS